MMRAITNGWRRVGARGLQIAITAVVGGATTLPAADSYPSAWRTGLTSSDFRTCGVPGGVPDSYSKTVYTNLVAGLSLSTLNTVEQACPSNQVIQLAAGGYDLGGEWQISKHGIIVRGATNGNGMPATFFTNCTIKIAAGSWPNGPNSDFAGITAINISSGLTEGSVSITLASAPNSEYVVGNLMVIDQTDDGVNVMTSTLGWAHRDSRSYCMPVLITNISGSTIGFTPPLLGNYWSAGQDPEAYAWSVIRGDTVKMVGFESIDIVEASGGLYTAQMGPAYGCWMVNNRITDYPPSGGSAAIHLSYSSQCSIDWNIIHDQTAVQNSAYAIYPRVVSLCSIDYNILTNVPLGIPCISAVGCSFSFNYGDGPYAYNPSSWLPEYFFPHGGHTHHCLWEGNWIEAPMWFDAIFDGNNSRCAIVHNRIEGWSPDSKTGNLTPVRLEAQMDDIVFLSNVLGHDGSVQVSYPGDIFDVDGSCQNIFKTNNYNTVSDAVPSGEAKNAGETIAASYRLTAQAFNITGSHVDSTATNSWAWTNWNAAAYRNWSGKFPPAFSQGGGAGSSATKKPTLRSMRLKR